jgi:hypothetical protein
MAYRDPEKEKAHVRAWRKANPEKVSAACRAWKKANPEKVKAWEKANREKRNAQSRARYAVSREKYKARNRARYEANREQYFAQAAAWAKANPGKVNAKKQRRRAGKLRATPAWANREKITETYELASILGLTVDHIVPLRSPAVCGLHWEGNMQFLTLRENASKGNRLHG